MASSSFSAGESEWLGQLGQLRDVVRQRLVARQLADALAERESLRVLDVGCGQGTQALELARAGHRVIGLDSSPRMLAEFSFKLGGESPDVAHRLTLVQGSGEDAATLTPGPFDVVLCHGVLMYLGDLAPMLAALGAVATDDAVLSLLVRNGLAPAMRDGLRGNWSAALAAFDNTEYVNRLGLVARGHTPEELDVATAPYGWTRAAWHGVRVFTDHRQEAPTADLEPLIAAELEAGARDPYRQVAGLFHLIYQRQPAGQWGR